MDDSKKDWQIPYGYDYRNNPLVNPVMPNILLPENMEVDEDEIEQDMMYMKRMYPDIAKEINEFVEDKCDQLEYEGSPMFDQYPDKVIILKIVAEIYDKVKYRDEMLEKQNCGERNCGAPPPPPPHHPHRPAPPPPPNDNPIMNLIGVMLCNEMYCRRRRHNRKQRMFY